jgi:signal transduction histidine kinase
VTGRFAPSPAAARARRREAARHPQAAGDRRGSAVTTGRAKTITVRFGRQARRAIRRHGGVRLAIELRATSGGPPVRRTLTVATGRVAAMSSTTAIDDPLDQAAERAGLAAQLHDLVTHQATIVTVQLAAAQTADAKDNAELLAGARVVVDQLSQDLRRIGRLLPPERRAPLVPTPSVATLVERIAGHTGADRGALDGLPRGCRALRAPLPRPAARRRAEHRDGRVRGARARHRPPVTATAR